MRPPRTRTTSSRRRNAIASRWRDNRSDHVRHGRRGRPPDLEEMMGIGPVEYMVVAFPGNQFKGEIAPALGDLVDNGTIRVLDLAFIMKDEEGNVVGAELEDVGSEVTRAFEALSIERGGL